MTHPDGARLGNVEYHDTITLSEPLLYCSHVWDCLLSAGVLSTFSLTIHFRVLTSEISLSPPQIYALQHGRESKAILSFPALNITHKGLCATALGLFGRYQRSVLQLVLLIIIQLYVLLHLLIWRPYIGSSQQLVEVVCHAAEMLLFSCAFGLLNSVPDNSEPTTWLMIGKFDVPGPSCAFAGHSAICGLHSL